MLFYVRKQLNFGHQIISFSSTPAQNKDRSFFTLMDLEAQTLPPLSSRRVVMWLDSLTQMHYFCGSFLP